MRGWVRPRSLPLQTGSCAVSSHSGHPHAGMPQDIVATHPDTRSDGWVWSATWSRAVVLEERSRREVRPQHRALQGVGRQARHPLPRGGCGAADAALPRPKILPARCFAGGPGVHPSSCATSSTTPDTTTVRTPSLTTSARASNLTDVQDRLGDLAGRRAGRPWAARSGPGLTGRASLPRRGGKKHCLDPRAPPAPSRRRSGCKLSTAAKMASRV